jgi:hypothetical protein
MTLNAPMTMQKISDNSEFLLYIIIAQLSFLMCQAVMQGRKRAIFLWLRKFIHLNLFKAF